MLATLLVVLSAVPCSADAGCGGGGVCVYQPGCVTTGMCLPSDGYLPRGTFCSCRNTTLTGLPLEPIEGIGPCEPPDAGVRLPPARPRIQVEAQQPARLSANQVCEGGTVDLTPPPGARFPSADAGVSVFIGCGVPLHVSAWAPERITAVVPRGTGSGCVWLGRTSTANLARLSETRACGPATRHGLATRLARELPELDRDGGVRQTACGGCREICAPAGRTHLEVDTPPRLAPLDLTESPAGLLLAAPKKAARIKSNRLDALGRSAALEREFTLVAPGDVVTAENACGAVRRKVFAPRAPRFEVERLVLSPKVKRTFKLTLPKPATADQKVKLEAPPGVVVPKTVTLKAGQSSIEVSASLSAAPDAGVTVGALRVLDAQTGAELSTAEVSAAAPLRGFADLHNHMFANLGFGGEALWGTPAGELDEALGSCWVSEGHGFGGAKDFLGNMLTGRVAHGGSGAPTFESWPTYEDPSHQVVYRDWLERAWRGGLRLMVLLAVNNQQVCDVVYQNFGHAKFPCDDVMATRLQIDAAWNFQRLIDDENGGDGWFRIVTDASQARDAVAAGKLAVVLGVEVDSLLGCTSVTACTDGVIKQRLQELHDAGVRHVFPVHFTDNAYGGCALENSATVSKVPPRDCTSEGYERRVYGLLNRDQGHPVCNFTGLTVQGKLLIRELKRLKMIIDVDHMSVRAQNDTFALTTDYPVVSGHTGLFALSKSEQKHEGNMKDSAAQTIYARGGMVSLITNQSDDLANTIALDPQFPNGCGKSLETFAQSYLHMIKLSNGAPVAFGTDFNGFAGQPGPRLGDGRCPGNKWPITKPQPNAATLVQYPFTSVSGEQMWPSALGEAVYDVNKVGLAHVGMLPDFIAGLRALGLTEQDLEPLASSADGYVRMWERIDARP